MVKLRFEVCYVFHLVFLAVEITSFANVSALSSFSESCNRSRLVLTETYGIISSGDNKYPVVSHCEWLIKANDSGQFITLHFNRMDTECSYDHIFIYDGNSYTSPVLASFSGNSSPPDITARSGAMLILFYSDTNYVLNGFEATYSITDCPLNCSNRGLCEEHECYCTDSYIGNACERHSCPNLCGDAEGRGKCVSVSKSHSQKCQCKIGYSGIDCSLPDSNKNDGNSWHILSEDGMGFTGRAGHIGVYLPTVDRFYVFGGYTFSKVLGDLMYFEFSSNSWVAVNPPVNPSPRRHHAAVEYRTNIVLYGGELDRRQLSNELWLLNVTSHRWRLLHHNGTIFPPPLSKHSLTLVEDKWLYLFGGHRQDGSISSDMYRISLFDGAFWEKVPYLGGQKNVPKVVGHSAVYYQPYKTILIFGGLTTETSNLSKLSSSIHAFHVERKFWTQINYYDRNIPLERAFHTAAIVDEYMVIHGGYTHKHSEEEICYDNATYLYHLKCHKWVDLPKIAQDFKGSENPLSQGVFSHTMGVRHGRTLLINGGYSGIMRSSFLAYVLPSSIVGGHPLTNPCSRHKSKDGCVANVACGWCSSLNACVERSHGNESCANLFTEVCPGFCPTLSNCYACLIWGETPETNTINDSQLTDPFPAVSCVWCVQARKCYSVDAPPVECSHDSNFSTHPQNAKWWGSEGTEIHNLSNCTSQDFPPGLISIVYRYPTDHSVPDNVSYVSNASETLEMKSKSPCGNQSENKNSSIILTGFLHPLGVRPKSERISLQMQMCSKISTATLKLSTDNTSEHLEKVAHHQMNSAFVCTDVRQKHSPNLFPELSKGHKYLLNFEVQIPGCINETILSHLSWNAFEVQSEVISKQYLEPYKNGSFCEMKRNCLSCLTDNLCAWCEAHSKCYNRMKGLDVCRSKGEIYFLVTQPGDCSVCKDRNYCEQCLEAENCEWVDDAESSECSRVGRHADAVPWNGSCPTPCYLRTTCASCLGEPGFCTWCESTQTCFMFSTYTSSYMYGQCRDWVDEKRSRLNGQLSIDPVSMCRDCSCHNTCQSCLSNLNCGWCYNIEYPNNGTCVLGDFSGPSAKNCTTYLEEKSSLEENSSSPSPLFSSEVFWSYSKCPDVNECLENHNCHPNATCTNTPDSYTCECNFGFKGDGKSCTRVCAVKCINGICSDDPEYKCICDLGWTGEDCSENCGCHNHSTCSKGIGICDECQNLTEGQFCEKCKIGSFGDATTPAGCQKCSCNNHGKSELGYCNITTGVCFCEDNTEGPNCSKCPHDYYGDPRNGGSCFLKCLERAVITNVYSGKLGSPAKTDPSSDCLWILTVYPVLDILSLLEPMPSSQAVIKLHIHSDIRILCPLNHVYVYDGLPDFIASGHPNVLLGAFCGSNMTSSMTVVAKSGYLTIHFKRNEYNQGFNSTYERFELCSEACIPHQETGKLNMTEYCCGRKICPNDCFSSKNQGHCDMGYGICICNDSFGGDDCSVPLKSYNLIWTSVYDYDSIVTNTSDAPPARLGGSLLTVWNEMNSIENLWLYGGCSLKFPDMNDMFMFETLNKHWIKISTERIPPHRYFHAAVASGYFIYVYGGLSRNEILGDFWQFNTVNRTWSQLKTQAYLPPLACSSLTAIKDERLVLIGGYAPIYGFFDKILEFDIANDIWYTINSTGTQPIGIYGHTSVYHSQEEVIYVYGGIVHNGDRVSDSNKLYAFHYTSKHWYSLPPDNRVNPLHTRPLSRYFHDAIVTEKYMVVLGGRSSNTSNDYPRPFAYVFSCNIWIPLTDKDIEAVGNPPGMLVGTSAAVANGDIYLFGGFNGKVIGELKVLSIPTDFCNLFSHGRIGCIYHAGCAFCKVHEKGINQTFCYSENWHTPSCNKRKRSLEVTGGTMCNSDWIEKLDCTQYSSCTDCLGSWLIFREAKQVCQWCSNCKTGRCISSGASCEYENDCSVLRRTVNQSSVCPQRLCGASDCGKCQVMKNCMWTRPVQWSGGLSHFFREKPTHDWICVTKEWIDSQPPFPPESLPPKQCPAHCYQHTNCSSCLDSTGGEGGWHECHWSEALNMCMSPSFELLRCEDGSCGPVLQGNASVCPAPCWQHFQASHCLSHAHCGWCAFSGSKVDGRGLCIEGGIMGPSPIAGKCTENDVLLFNAPLPEKVEEWLSLAEGPPKWSYLVKPPENECANGHHTCDEKHEECVDTVEGFKCQCKSGYSSKDGHCKPICKQGCVNGTCISPDVCSCNFGYVGDNCSIPCKCNGHSNCPGPDHLSDCTECHNNTQGPECQKCKPLFVGNPVNGGKCIPCHTYCNGHSSYCSSIEFHANNNASLSSPADKAAINEQLEKLTEGALENDAICWDCQNYTKGNQCDKCVDGYFKVGEKISEGCRLCECHGHGDRCDPDTGENCKCDNHTETQCSQKNTKNIMTPCWQLQCSKCKEYYLGAPSYGHQCYRHMFMDKDYCFVQNSDISSQAECNDIPSALLQGRTVFFAVQPRYMNVDIRIVVDVTKGGIDFFLSAKEDTFVIEVNKTNGIHHISLDKKYGTDIWSDFDFMYNDIKPKAKRETFVGDSSHDPFNSSETYSSSSLHLHEAKAKGLTTYVTVKRPHEFLLIRNLQNRLVITIPQEVHDLRSTRFYMVLRGAGSKSFVSTYGNLFFRQDQTRIDLFVFFSVFFSCFFLFLAICVVIWKVKQAFDVRRARRLHAAEMKHMASRPFGHIITIIEDEPDEYDFMLYSPSNNRKKGKQVKAYGRDSPKILEDKFGIRPMAIEPLSDGAAAVATILIQLPGGPQSLVKMTLASALITTRSAHHHVSYGLRAAMRRRTSHANV